VSSNLINSMYSYTTTFNITSEKDLDDLWSYCIFRLNLEKYAYTYDRFARLYNFLNDSKKLLSTSKYINITLRESNEEYLLYIDTTITEMIDEFMKRLNRLGFSYEYEKNILSYSIQKKETRTEEITNDIQTEIWDVYNFINQDDLDEMSECIEKMQYSNYDKVYIDLSIEEINAYRTTLSYYSTFLRHYPQLNAVSNPIAELSVILSLYSDECLRLGTDFRQLLKSFVNNIWYWQEKLFVNGGAELHFMDDSFVADLSQIKMALNLYDENIEENSCCLVDDIFDF